jgi:hypothetical protein
MTRSPSLSFSDVVDDGACLASFVEGSLDFVVANHMLEHECLRPHFHVWEPITFAGFLAAIDLPCSLELLQASVAEFVVVLRKR